LVHYGVLWIIEDYISSLLKFGLDSTGKNSWWWLSMSTLPRARRSVLLPTEFVPWVEARLREGFEVHVVYVSCGFGYGLNRASIRAGPHCYVIAPQKLDEGNTRVKTDGRDGHALCLRLDRYLAATKTLWP
jgi:hypothetical protein